jgi:hypothetical protein
MLTQVHKDPQNGMFSLDGQYRLNMDSGQFVKELMKSHTQEPSELKTLLGSKEKNTDMKKFTVPMDDEALLSRFETKIYKGILLRNTSNEFKKMGNKLRRCTYQVSSCREVRGNGT